MKSFVLKNVAVFVLAVIILIGTIFPATPAYADSVSVGFDALPLKVKDVVFKAYIDQKAIVLTKSRADTGERLGLQYFSLGDPGSEPGFYGMMWVPEHNVLLVAGVIEDGYPPVLLKILGAGGSGNNMFAVFPDGQPVANYPYRLGRQIMKVKSMRYNGNLEVSDGAHTTYRIKGTGGTGDNMFALQVRKVDDWEYQDGCGTLDGYDYFKSCIRK